MQRLIFALTTTVFAFPLLALGQEPAPTMSPEEAAIRKQVAAYVQAFNKGDAQALAAAWAPEAVYINRLTGEQVVGRAAIAEQFSALFKVKMGLKLEVKIGSIRLLSPSVAVEQGMATLTEEKAAPEEMPYTAVYVRQGGQWLLDRVTDEAPEAPSHYEQLKSLEWLVGRWVDQDENVRVETECKWAKNQNFLVRSFSVAAGDKIEMAGMQVIGWDASAKAVRSWTFDSDGGFAEARWSSKGDRWYIHNQGVLADGRKATMVNVIKKVNDDSFTWQTIERTVAGELLPNVSEVLIVRQ